MVPTCVAAISPIINKSSKHKNNRNNNNNNNSHLDDLNTSINNNDSYISNRSFFSVSPTIDTPTPRNKFQPFFFVELKSPAPPTPSKHNINNNNNNDSPNTSFSSASSIPSVVSTIIIFNGEAIMWRPLLQVGYEYLIEYP